MNLFKGVRDSRESPARVARYQSTTPWSVILTLLKVIVTVPIRVSMLDVVLRNTD